ncbi:hypothetical protein CDCA_CDCA16G4180 [Cyanidium caldarium]|uniref:RNB domain-containing protein n=1 Tax=Cyanidium caldarium TaxID=2771 RepID=A0AAV9J1F8_CYACA|nr:hypothetical protein CDCA_CDCA16G4180 [Cyanidium caldarium]
MEAWEVAWIFPSVKCKRRGAQARSVQQVGGWSCTTPAVFRWRRARRPTCRPPPLLLARHAPQRARPPPVVIAEVWLRGQVQVVRVKRKVSAKAVEVVSVETGAAEVVAADQLISVWESADGGDDNDNDDEWTLEQVRRACVQAREWMKATDSPTTTTTSSSSSSGGGGGGHGDAWSWDWAFGELRDHWRAVLQQKPRQPRRSARKTATTASSCSSSHGTAHVTHSGVLATLLWDAWQDRRRRQYGTTAAGAIDQLCMRVVAAWLLAADHVHFKRVPMEGGGWRALPDAAVRTRLVETFCGRVLRRREQSEAISDVSTATTTFPDVLQRAEHLSIVRELETLASAGMSTSSSTVPPLAAAVLRRLGLPLEATAAAQVLLDAGYWAASHSNDHGSASSASDDMRRVWAFAPEVLHAAQQLRAQWTAQRQALSPTLPPDTAVYCIDAPAARFLDDALSLEWSATGALTVHVHVTELGSRVPADGLIDRVARERAQSLYLPGQPLHLLPPSLSEAASFSEWQPTPVLTVSMRFADEGVAEDGGDVGRLSWFAVREQVVPEVQRLSYDQVDRWWTEADAVTEEEPPLGAAAAAAAALRRAMRSPGLARRVHARLASRRAKSHGRVTSVRQHRSGWLQVSEFTASRTHGFVDAVLMAAGEALARYARRQRIPVPLAGPMPGDGGAGREYWQVRFGTAPLRRYLDLVALRQVVLAMRQRQGGAAGSAAPLSMTQVAQLTAEVRRAVQRGMSTQSRAQRALLFDALAQRQARALSTGAPAPKTTAVVRQRSADGRSAEVLLDGGLTATLEWSPRRDGERKKSEEEQQVKEVPAVGERVSVVVASMHRERDYEVRVRVWQPERSAVRTGAK